MGCLRIPRLSRHSHSTSSCLRAEGQTLEESGTVTSLLATRISCECSCSEKVRRLAIHPLWGECFIGGAPGRALVLLAAPVAKWGSLAFGGSRRPACRARLFSIPRRGAMATSLAPTALLLVLVRGVGIEILYGDSATSAKTPQPDPSRGAISLEEEPPLDPAPPRADSPELHRARSHTGSGVGFLSIAVIPGDLPGVFR